VGAIRAFIDRNESDDLTREQNAHLQALDEMARTKADLFREIAIKNLIDAGNGTDKTAPIVHILDTLHETYAYSSQNASGISEKVNSALMNLIGDGDEQINSGISKLMSQAVIALFKNNEKSADMNIYFLAVEGTSIIRLDLYGWKRIVTSELLARKVEQVSAFVLVKSVVDVNRLDFNLFFSILRKAMIANDGAASMESLMEKARSIYDKAMRM
jgi:hypothetical protein